jgi:putative transposase
MSSNFSFTTGEYYHIYNRGVDKRDIFLDDSDYFRFLKSLKEFNQLEPVVSLYINDRIKPNVGVRPLQNENDELVEIIAFNLIPNHYHLILKQLKDGGISEFMKRIGGGYTSYFNYKNERSGALFQGKFKAVHVTSNEKLLFLSAYVNGNHIVHGAEGKIFSSLREYSTGKNSLCNIKLILDQFKNANDYLEYVQNTAKEINKIRAGAKGDIIED